MPKLLQLFFSVVRPLILLKWAIYLIVAAIVWTWVDFHKIQDYLEARERREAYEQEVKQLESMRQQLEKDGAEMKTGGFQLEKTIREKQYMVYPGEKIIIVETPEIDQQTPAAAVIVE